MSGQTKRMSAVETLASTAIGFAVAFVAQIWIMERFGIECDFGRDLLITAFFTVISLVRGYFVRRLFNWLHLRDAEIAP
jgi:hypothetical protein